MPFRTTHLSVQTCSLAYITMRYGKNISYALFLLSFSINVKPCNKLNSIILEDRVRDLLILSKYMTCYYNTIAYCDFLFFPTLEPDYVLLKPSNLWQGQASSTYSGTYSAAKAFDGSVRTFYHSAGTTSKFHWIQLDLGKSISVRLVNCVKKVVQTCFNTYAFRGSLLYPRKEDKGKVK